MSKKLKTKTKRRLNPKSVSLQKRLHRIQGQVLGVERMLSEGRYCIDVINVLKATQAALKSVENQILETHLKECVRGAFESKKKSAVKKKINEIIKLI